MDGWKATSASSVSSSRRARPRSTPETEGHELPERNVETLRRYHERLNEKGELALELVDPEVEVHMFEGSPIPGPYVGHEGLRLWREDVCDVIDDWHLELDGVIEMEDPDVVVAMQR